MQNPPAEVIAQYAWGGGFRVRPLGGHGGFSGARIWRITDALGVYCLKRWPTETSVAWLAWTHDLLNRAHAAELRFVPRPLPTIRGDTVVEAAAFVWDLCTWMPGVADYHAQPSERRLRTATHALAQLHQCWQGARRWDCCPGVQRRLGVLEAWGHLLESGWQPRFDSDDPAGAASALAWHWLAEQSPRARQALQPWRDTPMPIQPCWCDPWHDNLLFSGHNLTGLIDHGSIKEDHPAVDLARLLGSLAGPNPDRWHAGLAAYRGGETLSERDEALLEVLEWTGRVVAAVNWLRWLYYEGRPVDRAAAAQRLRTACGNGVR